MRAQALRQTYFFVWPTQSFSQLFDYDGIWPRVLNSPPKKGGVVAFLVTNHPSQLTQQLNVVEL